MSLSDSQTTADTSFISISRLLHRFLQTLLFRCPQPASPAAAALSPPSAQLLESEKKKSSSPSRDSSFLMQPPYSVTVF